MDITMHISRGAERMWTVTIAWMLRSKMLALDWEL